MRFLELRPDGTGPSFELDRRLTLLHGLDPAERVALVGFVHSVAAGESFDWVGTVEAHGVQMGLVDLLAMVGPTADAAVIVEGSSLIANETPTSTNVGGERAPLEARLAQVNATLAAHTQKRHELNDRIDAAEAAVDRRAGARLDHADGELSRAARLADRPDPWTGADDLPTRAVELEALVAELDARVAALPSSDRAAIASAAATARLAAADGPTPDPESVALAEAWLSLHQRLAGLESRVESAGGGTEAVAARLERARANEKIAKEAAVPRPIAQEEADRLETLHERLVETERRTGRAVRKGAAVRDFEEAQSELMEALDAIGYPSWAAFRMGNGTASVRPDLLQAYEQATYELEVAELEWAALVARLEADTDLQSVLNAVEAALEHAVSLLGHDPYAGGGSDDPNVLANALRSRLVDPRGVQLDRAQAFAQLRTVLQPAPGIDQVAGERSLLALAETWLDALAAADAAAVRILRDRERAAMELQEITLLGDGKRVDRLDRERADVRRVEREVALQRARLIELAHLRLEFHELAAGEVSLAEQRDVTMAELAAIERAVAAAMPPGIADVAARIPRGGAGPIPLVVLMGDAPASVIASLDALPDDVQVIVVGGGEATAEAVRGRGGLCTRPAQGAAVG